MKVDFRFLDANKMFVKQRRRCCKNDNLMYAGSEISEWQQAATQLNIDGPPVVWNAKFGSRVIEDGLEELIDRVKSFTVSLR